MLRGESYEEQSICVKIREGAYLFCDLDPTGWFLELFNQGYFIKFSILELEKLHPRKSVQQRQNNKIN